MSTVLHPIKYSIVSTMQYQVKCGCGHSISVLASQAGSLAKCKCGQMLQVPSLGELKRSSTPDDELIKSDASSPVKWRGLVATLAVLSLLLLTGNQSFLVVACLGCILVGKVWLCAIMLREMGAAALLTLLTPVVDMLFASKRFDVAWRPVALQLIGVLFLSLSLLSSPPHVTV